MKTRFLLAAALSLGIHWLFFGLNWSFLKDRRVTIPKTRNVTITMSYREPELSAGHPRKTKKKTGKTPIKAAKEIRKKEIMSPLEPEKAEVAPDPLESEAKDAKDSKKELSDDTIPETKSRADDVSDAAVIKEASPLYRKNPPPVYPRVARRRGHQGTVSLEVLVDRNGSVKDLRVLQSSGYAALDDAALASVKDWIFEPGTRGNQCVEMWVKLPVRFQLK